jgi:hypothetical protein
MGRAVGASTGPGRLASVTSHVSMIRSYPSRTAR